jgi:hypothetical protein
VLVASCTENPKPPAHEIVEWVQVEGSCHEDHATQAGHYSGDLIHSRNKATGVSNRGGVVSNPALMDEAAMQAQREHPARYQPPFSIYFSNIAAADFQSEHMVLHGFSDANEDGSGYEATCNLTVQRRLDHQPSKKERQEWAPPHSG